MAEHLTPKPPSTKVDNNPSPARNRTSRTGRFRNIAELEGALATGELSKLEFDTLVSEFDTQVPTAAQVGGRSATDILGGLSPTEFLQQRGGAVGSIPPTFSFDRTGLVGAGQATPEEVQRIRDEGIGTLPGGRSGQLTVPPPVGPVPTERPIANRLGVFTIAQAVQLLEAGEITQSEFEAFIKEQESFGGITGPTTTDTGVGGIGGVFGDVANIVGVGDDISGRPPTPPLGDVEQALQDDSALQQRVLGIHAIVDTFRARPLGLDISAEEAFNALTVEDLMRAYEQSPEAMQISDMFSILELLNSAGKPTTAVDAEAFPKFAALLDELGRQGVLEDIGFTPPEDVVDESLAQDAGAISSGIDSLFLTLQALSGSDFNGMQDWVTSALSVPRPAGMFRDPATNQLLNPDGTAVTDEAQLNAFSKWEGLQAQVAVTNAALTPWNEAMALVNSTRLQRDDSDRRLNEALADDEFETAAEAAFLRDKAQTQLAEQELQLNRFTVLLSLIQDPNTLLRLHRSGTLGSLVAGLGVDFTGIIPDEKQPVETVMQLLRGFGDFSKMTPQQLESILQSVVLQSGWLVEELIMLVQQLAQASPGSPQGRVSFQTL